jgi:hypothetical protein
MQTLGHPEVVFGKIEFPLELDLDLLKTLSKVSQATEIGFDGLQFLYQTDGSLGSASFEEIA